MDNQFETPVLFLIFNRPDTTQQVFNQIRQIKPKYLYVAADGPRLDKLKEIEKCSETRSIIKQIDWDCELKTLFRDKNLGCKVAVSSAISWFFDNIEEGIIIEDDVLPDTSFFSYCEELLERYRNDSRIFQINGTNFLTHKPSTKASYFFSKYPFIWGWATWKRAWANYDINMTDYPECESYNFLENVFLTKKEQKYFLNSFKRIYYDSKFNSWDPQWDYAVMKNNGLSISPIFNLTINIGTNNQSTHSFLSDSMRDGRKLEPISKPLIHPLNTNDFSLDSLIFENFRGRSLSRIFRIINENGIINVLKYYYYIHLRTKLIKKLENK